MKKTTKRIICIGVAALAVASVTATTLVMCLGGRQENDPETTPLKFSIDALDGNFNPFFATSASDSTIAAQTQIGMLTTDASGKPTCGENEPTVVLSYTETMKKGSATTTNAEEATSTEYEFVIKNGIQFSDGTPLTIKDVLFNLYVYLDPMYTGSATIYSTKIKGLNAYRWQDPQASDESDINEGEEYFYSQADARITNVINHLSDKTTYPVTDEITADIALTKNLFREEVERDWTANAGTLESYKDQYRFTQDWEVFFFAEGLIELQYTKTATSTTTRKDAEGKYYTSLDADVDGNVKEQALIDEMNAAITAEERAQAQANKCTTEAEIKAWVQKQRAINTVVSANTMDTQLENVLIFWETGNNLREELAADIRSAYYDALKQENEGLLVKTISGITTSKTTVNGQNHDVLKITINGVDPKAIWNFAFSVAPMHYYAGQQYAAKANGVDYFGVEYNNKEFFQNVLQDPVKNALPMGAGAYQASNSSGASTGVDGDDFYSGSWVYFTRNNYFNTVGSGLNNAKIKNLWYKVVPNDQILNSLINNEIHVGSPNAKPKNISDVDRYEYLEDVTYTTNGYGYVGINPKAVPDIEVRQAIMKAMDTASIVKNYYSADLAETIHRSMSTESWAYPKVNGKNVGQHEKVKFSRNAQEICTLVEAAGYRRADENSVYIKDGKPLKLVFTIAGESKDHPAYDMFAETAEWLNENCGFDITVTTDIQALSKLATGDLQVWAAAWSSSIDPDLYQVYHKDSSATSVKNWGYPTIFADSTGQFTYEKGIINQLSEKIEAGRATINRNERTKIYAEALDLIMELCVELPTYQRNDMIVYNKKLINSTTINATNASSTSGVFDRIWEVDYN